MSNTKLSNIIPPAGVASSAQGAKADTALQPSDNVSALTNDAQYIDAAGAPVQSVNGETGEVSIDAGDVGLGNVPNLDTTDAVNKAHGQNTDTALASGTADEVSAVDAKRASLLSYAGPYKNAIIYDSFRRPNRDVSEGLGVADSGQTWIDLPGVPSGFRIINQSAFGNGDDGSRTFGATFIELPSSTNSAWVRGRVRRGLEGAGFIIAKNPTNMVYIENRLGEIRVVDVIDGVSTVRWSNSFGNSVGIDLAYDFGICYRWSRSDRTGIRVFGPEPSTGVIPPLITLHDANFGPVNYIGLMADRIAGSILNVTAGTS